MEDLVHLFKTYLILFSIGYSEVTVKGQLTLSPMSVVPVCNVGDPLQLTCTASAGIKWNIFRVDVKVISDVLITFGMAKNQMIPMTVDSVMFTFIKKSAPGASPVVSTLSIDSVSWNRTVVNCSDLLDSTTSAATTIQLIDTSQNFFLYAPILRISDERYETDDVIVTVEWMPLEGITYTTSVSPLTSITVTGSSSRQLTISYNTNYNFSVEAAPPCRPNPTAVITLNYVKCGNPEMLFTLNFDNDTIPRIEDYDDMVPTLEGRTVSFSCPPGFILTGPDSATCTGNGEWEPDPKGSMCNNVSSEASSGTTETHSSVNYSPYNSTLERAIVTFWFTDLPQQQGNEGLSGDGKIAVASSVTVFTVASILFFIIGFLCRHFCQKKRKSSTRAAAGETVPPGGSGGQTQTPYYDDVVIQQSDQELELKDNVAYGPIRSIINV